jgi:hypothetical protein
MLAMPAMLTLVLASGVVDASPLLRPVSEAEGRSLAGAVREAAVRNGCWDSTAAWLTPPGKAAPPPKDCGLAFKTADIAVFWSDETTVGSPRHVLALERLPARWPLEETWIAYALIPRSEADENAGYDFSWTSCALARTMARQLRRYAPEPGPLGPEHPRAVSVGPLYVSDAYGGSMYIRAGSGPDRRERRAEFVDSSWGERLWLRIRACPQKRL